MAADRETRIPGKATIDSILFVIRWRNAPRSTPRLMQYYYLFPFLSSVLYVIGAMFIKQCTGRGAGVWRITFVSNLASAVMYLPMLWMDGEWPDA
ncbi:MAG: hypothetical protein ACPGVU_15700, partial [Limisphaerales bacterium]